MGIQEGGARLSLCQGWNKITLRQLMHQQLQITWALCQYSSEFPPLYCFYLLLSY